MNLVLIAAFVAVCSAAKLDRAYLPPLSAKTAGGSTGSLQTPFAGNSFNQGLGSFPKGSFTNDFQGVVVDAVAAGTRASEGETGLGAPRPSYGSSNSKVGDAAFSGNAGFRLGNTQAADENAGFRLGNTQAADEEENLDSGVQSANNQAAGIPQRFDANAQQYEAKSERAQAAYDRVANTLRFENEVGTDGYHYGFETDNGISAEENGVATNGVQAQGGYSYTGDDGQVYSVTYTADEGGYQPRGDHLPTPPPIPVEILMSLEQNARDEAAGLMDDGSYDAQRYNAGADYAESDITNEEQNNRRAPNFGRRPESDATASGTFINQNNQAFVRPNLNEVPNEEDGSTNVRDSSDNAFGSSNSNNGFGQAPQSNRLQSNRFGSRNEYRPSSQGFKQNDRPQRPNAPPVNNIQYSGEGQENNSQYTETEGIQEPQPSLPFGESNRNTLETHGSANNVQPSRNNRFQPSRNSLSSTSGQFSNRFASSNEYLPPVRGQPARPQRPFYSAADAVPEQSFNQVAEIGIDTTGQEKPSSGFTQDFSSQSNVGVQVPQPINTFQRKPQGISKQFSQSSNRFPAQNEKVTDEKSSVDTSFESQRPTSLPSTELTTPLESNEQSNEDSNESSDRDTPPATTFNAQNFNTRLPSQNGAQPNNKQPARPIANAQSQPSNTGFPIRGQNQYSFQSGNQMSLQGGFAQNQPEDAQFSPSTIRPSYNQQSQGQGEDDSYYYRQPAKPFNTPTSSRFPSSPSGQFNGLAQQSQAQFSESSQQKNPVNSFQPQRGQPNRGSTRYPEPPTLAPVAPTASINAQFQGTTSSQYSGKTQAAASSFQSQNGQASTRYPRPPTLAPTAPITPLGGFSSQLNGITQAAASAFTSGAPTTATNFNAPTFGSRPTFQTQYQQNKFQTSPAQTFGQRQPQSNKNKNQEDTSQATPTQQYSGEVYDYSKPAEMLPAPAKPEVTSSIASSQRGQPQSQLSQTQDNRNSQEYSAQPTRASFGARPQISSQRPSQRPQFTQNTAVNTEDQPAEDSNSQFNVQSRPNGNQSQRPQGAARPQFGQNSGRPNSCCQSLDAQISKLEAQRLAQGNRGFVRPQFAEAESQFSGPMSGGLSQAFAGRGEVFGGPRRPPSFDQETGYHY